MKRFAKVFVAMACVLVMCVGIVGCGSGGSSKAASSAGGSASASASQAAASGSAGNASQPQAKVDPATIDPGAPDVWHLNGDKSAEGIRFEKADNEAGLAFIRVLANGADGDGEFNLVITDEKHLRTPLGTAPKIDIVFADNANCYDYVTGNWYSRA